MPLSPRERLGLDALHPRIVDLWRALSALGSVVTFLQSGAHPDDETSEMLAALRFRDGISIAYVCSTRGEGGQNDIGAERGADLGTLRTAEMERAAEALDMRMFWLSESPDDSILDFGLSKSGTGTMGIWGRERVLARFVDVVREVRPDILMPTFLDVGGQHGHHRAMTEAAHLVFDLAADPSYGGSTRAPWAVSKLYLPAWGGGGGAYDDEVPPPPATVTVAGKGRDPVTGWSWANMGERSRAFHATQGMGRWIAPGHERDWPLHLARSRVGADRGAVGDNLPGDLAALGLDAAQAAIDEARAAFPDMARVASAAARALAALDGARVAEVHAHRLARKRLELGRVLRLAAGLTVRARLTPDMLLPGESAALEVELTPGEAVDIKAAPLVPEGWSAAADRVTAGADAPLADPYPVAWDPLMPRLPALGVGFVVSGQRVETRFAFETPPLLTPPVAGAVRPAALVLNLGHPQPLTARAVGLHPTGAPPSLDLPQGWRQDWSGDRVALTPPGAQGEALVVAPLHLGDARAMDARSIRHPHVAPLLRAAPAALRVLAARIALPDVVVGYVGNGSDTVADWLSAMGLEVRLPSAEALASGEAFEGIGALVVGVFGFRNAALGAALPRLHAWVKAGGTLVTLYHRPGDNWDPQATPPRRIEIGSPSLRWRVTDEAAPVTVLRPGHPVLTGPNAIGPEDWEGWSKERGLYFARSWDPAYEALIEIADPGEAPHRGALLTAEIGHGRHNHVALNLHHQMPELVPGAFRLMANLVAPRARS